MTRVLSKSIRIEGPDEATDSENQDVHDGIMWGEVEEFVNDMLPEGYYCKVEDGQI